MQKVRQVEQVPNLIIGTQVMVPGALSPGGGGGGLPVRIFDAASPDRCIRLMLDDLRIDVPAVNDYASAELIVLPNRDLIIKSAKIHVGPGDGVTLTQGGVILTQFTSNAGSALDVSIGTAAASSTTLNGTMANVLQKVDAIDVTAGLGHVNGFTDQSTGGLRIAAGAANKLYLNVADFNTLGGQLSFFAGWVDLVFADLGAK